MSLEAADGVPGRLAFGLFAGDVVAGFGVAAGAVIAIRWIAALIWRLPPRSSRWRSVLPELMGIGAMPAARASLASEANRSRAGDLADELGCGEWPAAGLGDKVGREAADQRGDLGFERSYRRFRVRT